MKIIVDTNIVISCLLTNGRTFSEILFSMTYDIYSCNFLIVELFDHKDKIIKYSKGDEREILICLHNILSNIRFVNESFINMACRYNAFQLCVDIDPKDTPFVALALELDALLWTGDKKLKEGLKNKGFNNFFEP